MTAAVLQPALRTEQARAEDPSPNIVVVQADDLDLDGFLTALNPPPSTPSLMPNLAQYLYYGNRATVFANSFVSFSLCCPSRATLLTGQYAHNHGVMGNDPPLGGCDSFEDGSTLATWLQGPPPSRYFTGIIGKYLNGYGSRPSEEGTCLDPLYQAPGWNDWQVLAGARENDGTVRWGNRSGHSPACSRELRR